MIGTSQLDGLNSLKVDGGGGGGLALPFHLHFANGVMLYYYCLDPLFVCRSSVNEMYKVTGLSPSLGLDIMIGNLLKTHSDLLVPDDGERTILPTHT